MSRRRSWHSPRGSLGIEHYKFSPNTSSGVPLPMFAVAAQAPSTWATLTHAFEDCVHASVNTITYYSDLNQGFPTSNVQAITAAGYYQTMTMQPSTGQVTVAGGVRASDGVVDNPMVSGTTYNGLVVTGSLFAGHVTQPIGSYVVLGGVSGGPNGITLQTSTPYTIASGSKISTSSFTPTKNYTIAFIFDFVGLTSGNYDSVIQSWATSAAGNNFSLRFAHEMNGNWYPWGTGRNGSGFTPAQYVAMWNHVRSVWRAQETANGTAHIPWIWCPNISNNFGNTAASAGVLTSGGATGAAFPLYAPSSPGAVGTGNCYYPGDTNCEFIGLDGYSSPSSYNGTNPTFASFVANDLTWLTSQITTTKQVLIGETGVDVSIGSAARAAWMQAMFAFFGTSGIAGVTYFNNSGSGNYAINTDPIACNGLLAGLQTWIHG